MEVEVHIPVALRTFTGGAATILATGDNILEVIHHLEMMYEGFKEELLDEREELSGSMNIYINNEDIRYLDGLNTSLHEGDIVSIIPAAGRS